MRAVLADILSEIRFPTMTLQEFGQNIACWDILTDKEVRYLFMVFSGAKPTQTLPFRTDKRTGKFQLLEFPVSSVSHGNIGYADSAVSILAMNKNANCDIEISEVHFCQPVGVESIVSVEIRVKSASALTPMIKPEEQMFNGYQVFTATFAKPFRFSCRERKPKIYFNLQPGCSNEVTMLDAARGRNPLNSSGKQCRITVGSSTSQTSWYCLTALRLRYLQQVEEE